MKITNISTSTVYLSDLKTVRQAQNEGRRGEDRYVDAGQSVYLPNTSEVLRSVLIGDIAKWVTAGILTIEDTFGLDAAGGADTIVLTHGFGFPPSVYILKQVGPDWVDATGTVDITHDGAFTTVTIANTTAFPLVFKVRLLT